MIEFRSAAEKLEFRKILNKLQAYASSDLGRHAAEHGVPLDSLQDVAHELDLVSEMKRLIESDDPFPIDGIKNIREPLQRAAAENSALTPPELLQVASTLQSSRLLRSYLLKRQDLYRELAALSAGIFINKVLEYNIAEAVDENGLVKDSASKELKAVRSDIVSMYDTLRKQLSRILREVSDQGLTQDDIITTREGRMVIPVKVEQKKNVPGFVHSSSASGSTVFVEPVETLSLNNEIRELHFREQREIDRILRVLTSQVREVAPEVTASLQVIEHLDFVYAKAKYSVEIKGNKPHLKESGSLKIVEGRHPVLLLRHPREKVIPLTLELGGKTTTLLITGPNAGGKSVAMKSVGLLVLMLQSGIHVPVSPDSEFPFFSNLFVDIGDDQSIEDDLSTFSSHILRLKNILESAGEGSLVLIDEIGAGTDPAEGGAIAASILGRLTRAGALTIATTHQVSLKAFAHEAERMENGAMEFDQSSLTPTYRFRMGVPGSSYALEIARRLGFPSDLLTEAERMTGEQKSRLEKLILDLESRSQTLSAKLESIESERLKLKELTQSYETKLDALKKEIAQIKAHAVEEAREILDRANSVIERSVREIRQRQADRQSINESKAGIKALASDLGEIEKSIDSQKPGITHTGSHYADGSTVRLRSNGQVGKLLKGPDDNGVVQIAVGNIKMRLHVAEIEPVSTPPENAQASHAAIVEVSASREVDVRGLYGDEALAIVDKFLDSAILAGLHRVDIIHGKGTGALKKKVGTFLTSDSRVKSYRLGEWNEGGAGVTVVELAE
ncbi:MAG TPA: endonuclease MutS2 [Bacteroidota bacterium]|nr:endonuclease MutS2 [Bacteroidota bacterium]